MCDHGILPTIHRQPQEETPSRTGGVNQEVLDRIQERARHFEGKGVYASSGKDSRDKGNHRQRRDERDQRRERQCDQDSHQQFR